MYLKKHLLVLATMSVVLVSCGEDENDVKQSSIFPMGVGNEWTYIDSTFNYYYQGGIETDTSKLQFSYYELHGYSGYSQIPIEGTNPISLFNTDDAGNFVEYTFLSDTLAFRTIIYKKDAHKGETWGAKSAFYTDYDPNVTVFEYDMKCICSDTLIHTPKGDFSCKGYSYSLNNGDDVIVTYLSENVGWVLLLHYSYYDGEVGIFQKSILLDYHIE